MCVSSLEGAVLTIVPIGYLNNDNNVSSKESIQLSGPLLNMQVCLCMPWEPLQLSKRSHEGKCTRHNLCLYSKTIMY